MIKKINHIGIVVKEINAMLSVLESSFGAQEVFRKEIAEQNQISSIVQLGEGYLELIAPTSPEGASGKFLEQRGEGLHHVSLLCDDVELMAEKLEKLGIRVIRNHPLSTEKTIFVHPKSFFGVLLEITNQDSSREDA